MLLVAPDGAVRTELRGRLASLGLRVVRNTDDVDLVVIATEEVRDVRATCARFHATDLDHHVDVVLLTDDLELARAAASDRDGPDDVRRLPRSEAELAVTLQLARRRIVSEARVRAQRQEFVDLSAQLFEQGRFDVLTGVGNRRAMDEHLAGLWSRATRHGQAFCVALFDIDHFKRLNDRCGHEEGDRVLTLVASALSEGRPGDTVHRYGGEEFLLTVPETTVHGGVAAAERRRQAVLDLSLPLDPTDPDETVTVSAGVACYDPAVDTSIASLLSRADGALYRAKSAGRNRVVSA